MTQQRASIGFEPVGLACPASEPDELHPAQPAAGLGAEEVEPKRHRIRTAGRQVENLGPPVGVDPDAMLPTVRPASRTFM